MLNNCRITTIYHIHYSAISAISTGLWFGTFGFFFHILGMSSSQLTHIFSEGLKSPPTSYSNVVISPFSTISWTIVTILNYSNYSYILNYPHDQSLWSIRCFDCAVGQIQLLAPNKIRRRLWNEAVACAFSNGGWGNQYRLKIWNCTGSIIIIIMIVFNL